jgi:uncharacterized protein YecE (DUF72 family)
MAGRIVVGVGGWTYEPWRGRFFPADLPQKQELGFLSRKLSSVEVNGTYYRTQSRDTYRKWHDETPDGFTFALKGPRFATNRRVLAEAGSSVERFLDSGVAALNDKLGPINWQLMPTKRFDPDDFAAFLALLPRSVEGCALRHAIELRHESFNTPDLMTLAREHQVGIVLAGDSHYPAIDDHEAPFRYVRIMGTSESEPSGYAREAVAAWADRARGWAAEGRDVFLYVISGFKARNPAAALALIEALGSPSPDAI